MNQTVMTLSVGIAQLLSVAAAAAPVFHRLHGSEHRETVVLVHGFNSSHATWDDLVASLSKKFRVFVYDQPGHGKSPAEGKDFSPTAMANRLSRLLDEVGIEKFHLVGHSMGGRTAVKFASLFPDRVLSLTVEDMGVEPSAQMQAVLPVISARYEMIRDGLPNEFASLGAAAAALSAFYSQSEIPWILAAAIALPGGRVQLGNRPEATHMYLVQGLAEDLSDDLAGVKVPVAFFAGDAAVSDTVLKGPVLENVRKVRPDAEVRVFTGSGHSIHRRAEFAEALEKFLHPN